MATQVVEAGARTFVVATVAVPIVGYSLLRLVAASAGRGGPPGHHRAKTARVWRYARAPEGHYLWHGPHGATYLVTDEGTQRV